MLPLIREHRIFFLGTTVTALALRLLFFFCYPMATDDSRSYADLATNWLQHGIYGQTVTVPPPTQPQPMQPEKQILPADTRLPGYPAFLAGIFWLFGVGNFRAVMLVQILAGLATCLIIADLARRVATERAAKIAFVLAAVCPFLANYSAAILTETLEIFFTTLALDCAAAALNRMHDGGAELGERKLWAATGAAIAACILLRPDGGILLAAVLLHLAVLAWMHRARKKSMLDFGVAGIIVAVFALALLVPWTIRNLRTLHQWQPLAPRYANASDEPSLPGFNRWTKTWIVDYVSVEEIYWNVPDDAMDPRKLPSRAFDTAAQEQETLAVIADYNQINDMTPELDARFGSLADRRIRAHPIRFYVELPLLRIADMWLRPRTEILPPDVRWWEFNDDAKRSATAITLGLLNLAYVVTALWAIARNRSGTPFGMRWAGLLLGFLLLRSAFLGSLENPEPRYTLECYPVVILWAAAGVANATNRRAV